MTHLDTSVLIRALQPGTPEEAKLRKLVGQREPLTMCSVAWAEFLCGPLGRADRASAERLVQRPRDFTPQHAEIAARLFNESGRRRQMFADCMIGAAALADGATIVTSNVAHFRRFAAAGLKTA